MRQGNDSSVSLWVTVRPSASPLMTAIASLTYSHPEWIVRALRQALVAHGRDVAEIDALLAADNAAPVVHLVALPGLATVDDALAEGADLVIAFAGGGQLTLAGVELAGLPAGWIV